MILRHVIEGTALGDSLGYPMEFSGYPSPKVWQKSLDRDEYLITDDTQMMLFLTEALLAGDTAKDAYLRWFETQIRPFKIGYEGLMGYPQLYESRAPGTTTMQSLSELKAKGTRTRNNSKGNGVVMRCAPYGILAAQQGWSLGALLKRAKADAELTHDHPVAAKASVFWATLHYFLTHGLSLDRALKKVESLLGKDRCFPYYQYMYLPEATFKNTMQNVTGGSADIAVAVALAAVWRSASFMQAIKTATFILGDSDTTAGLAGGLAAHVFPLPQKQVERLEIYPILRQMLPCN